MQTLFDHQTDDLLAGTAHSCLALWHTQGAGKSCSVILIAKDNGCEFVIAITPTTAVYVIADEVEKWAPGEWDVQVWRTKKDIPDRAPDNRVFAIVPWSLLSIGEAIRNLLVLDPDLLWVDEVHFGKTATSKRGEALFGVGSGRGREVPGMVDNADRIVLTSGTPSPNGRASELYGICRLFGDIPFDTTPWQHKMENGIMVQQRIGRRTIWKERGAKPAFLKRIRETHRAKGDWRRINKEELTHVAGMQPMRWTRAPFHPSPKFLKAYRAAIQKTREERKVSDLDAWPTVRRMIAEAKVEQAADYVRDLLEGGAEKVLVFAVHHNVIDQLQDLLLKDYGHVPILDGRSNELQRKQFSQAFNDGDCRVAIGQIVAAGTALTLHAGGKCTNVVFAESSPVPGDMAQAADRIHRIGQPNACVAHILTMRQTIEDSILQTVQAKLENIEVLVGDRAIKIS